MLYPTEIRPVDEVEEEGEGGEVLGKKIMGFDLRERSFGN